MGVAEGASGGADGAWWAHPLRYNPAMAVSAQFQQFVMDQMGHSARVTSRRLFGGMGYYASGTCFALAAADTLYFKVSASSRLAFERAGMEPFRPFGPGTRALSYWAVPAQVLDDHAALGAWMQQALAAAAAVPRRRRRAPLP